MRRERCHTATPIESGRAPRTERRGGEWPVVSGEQTQAAMSFQAERGICFSFRSQGTADSSRENRPGNNQLASRPIPAYFWPRPGIHFLSSMVGTCSWFGVRTRIVGAAGLFDGSEFHQLDAGVVGIVEIELPFAIAANLRFFGELHAVG